MATETSQTLDRGLRVLELLANTDHGLTVTQLANTLGVNRTVVYRLLATLEQHGLVKRDIGGQARVGLGVLGLAQRVHPLLRQCATPALRSLAEDLGATAHLTLADGGEGLAVAVVEPTWTRYHVACRPGMRQPLDQSAAGRAILAARSTRYFPRYRPQPAPGTANPGHGPAVTQDGTRSEMVFTHSDTETGISGAAVPLVGVNAVEASIGVVMLAEKVPDQVGPRVTRAAGQVVDALR